MKRIIKCSDNKISIQNLRKGKSYTDGDITFVFDKLRHDANSWIVYDEDGNDFYYDDNDTFYEV